MLYRTPIALNVFTVDGMHNVTAAAGEIVPLNQPMQARLRELGHPLPEGLGAEDLYDPMYRAPMMPPRPTVIDSVDDMAAPQPLVAESAAPTLADVLQVLLTEADANAFTADGRPRKALVESRLGAKVTLADLDATWAALTAPAQE